MISGVTSQSAVSVRNIEEPSSEKIGANPLLFESGSEISKEEKLQKAKEELMAVLYSELDLDINDKSFKAEIVEKDNRYCLKLTRVSENGTNYKLGDIKDCLSIADDVLARENDLKDVTGRPNIYKSDSATIEPQKSLFIPLEEIGTTAHKNYRSWFPGNLRAHIDTFFKNIA